MATNVEFRLLSVGDESVLDDLADEVFDHPIRPDRLREFLADDRHHIVVAIDGTTVVGMVSGFHYVHPDKRPELFVNELGVTSSHRRRGIGRRLIEALLERGRELGCTEAWVGTELDNLPARRLYEATGGREDDQPFALYTYRLE